MIRSLGIFTQNGEKLDQPRSGLRIGSLQHKAKRIIKRVIRNKYKIVYKKADDFLG